MKLILPLMLILSSCAQLNGTSLFNGKKTDHATVPVVSNRSFWLGKTSDDLVLHPIFATKAMERRQASNGKEVIAFKNKGGHTANHNNKAFGGFNSTYSEVTCNHVFYLQNDKITDYKRIGECTEEEDPALRPVVEESA